jgi:hypothetical protein
VKTPTSVSEDVASNVTEARDVHPLKIAAPTLMTDFGMLMDVRAEQPMKALSSIEVTDTFAAKEIVAKDVHPLNASAPMRLTEAGIVMLVKAENPLKAFELTSVMAGSVILTSAGQFEKRPNDDVVVEGLNAIDVKDVQFVNTLDPTDVTELGMLMDVSVEQPVNSASPIAVTDDVAVNVTEAKDAQPANVDPFIRVRDAGRTTLSRDAHCEKARPPKVVSDEGILMLVRA